MNKESEALELYGSESQVRRQLLYYHLWPFLKAHPRLAFTGRAMGLDDPALDEANDIAGLTKELGFLALAFTKADIADELASALGAQGLTVGFWQHLLSNEQTEETCSAVAAARQLPPGCKIERISADTPRERLRAVQELMQTCGVSPPPGFILRGQELPSIAEMVINPQDSVVATGASVFRHNPAGPYRKAAHVGYLATEPGYRGQGLAQLLLARVSLASFNDYGANMLHTGVRADNNPSQRVCHNCGLHDSGMFFVGVAYPPMLEGGSFTR